LRLAKAKGIRVSELAKELGVSAKSILTKLVSEFPEDGGTYKVSSSVGVGLAQTVRDWATAGELQASDDHGGTATAVAERPARKPPAKKKKGSESETSADETPHSLEQLTDTPAVESEGAPAVEETPEPETMEVVAQHDSQNGSVQVVEEAPAIEEVAIVEQADDTITEEDKPAAPTAPAFKPAAASTAGPKVVRVITPTAPKSAGSVGLGVTLPPPSLKPKPPAPIAKPAAPSVPVAKPVAPVAKPTAPGTPPPMPPATGGGGAAVAAAPGAIPGRPAPVTRPTVSINDAARAPVVLPPKVVPVKAALKGPQLIREEKPDIVAAPRPRTRPGTTGPGGATPAFQQARTVGGRGVKTTTAEDEAEEAAKNKNKSRGGGGTGRRGPDGRRGEADEKLKEFTQADLIELQERLNAAASYRSGVDTHLKKEQRRGQPGSSLPSKSSGPIELEEPITPKTLAQATGLKVNDVIKKLMQQGVFATINQPLDPDAALAIALDFGIEVVVRKPKTLEDMLMEEFDSRPRDEANLVIRPAVVTILGHVDHGKTSLLDKIRSANVAAGEAGGITQHIAAFSVQLDKGGDTKRVTFIDTPGHQAFTAMRARGANMTDVAVLVIDAAQGIQPQTLESINHARAAGVPIVVAMNKIDLPDANPDMVMGQLAAQDLSPVAWGGQTEMVKTSGRTGEGITDLIEILDLQAEILELKADPTSPARGSVIEARVDPGLGCVATVLVQDGTLKVGDVILAGKGYGRIRSLTDSTGKFIASAGPSTPVLVAGLSEVPLAGDKFFALDDLDRARRISEERLNADRAAEQASLSKVTLDGLFGRMKEGSVKTINLIVKGDVQGSVETLQKTVTDHNTEEVKVKVIHAAVGPINESDVELASASEAVIIGFNVVPDPVAQALAEQRRVEVRTYRVIYEIFDDLKKALSGMLAPEIREKHHGWIEIRQVFKVSKVGNIAGCYVTEGHISRGSKIRLVRDGNVITENLLVETLRRVKDDVKEVKMGLECGIKLANYDDIKIGDKLEAYIREEFKRTL
jgi:translation initiation factor IF-2